MMIKRHRIGITPFGGVVRLSKITIPNQKAVRVAVTALQSRSDQTGSCYTFRHSFATHLLESGFDIRTILELLGQNLALHSEPGFDPELLLL